jgi:hypothetical protein
MSDFQSNLYFMANLFRLKVKWKKFDSFGLPRCIFYTRTSFPNISVMHNSDGARLIKSRAECPCFKLYPTPFSRGPSINFEYKSVNYASFNSVVDFFFTDVHRLPKSKKEDMVVSPSPCFGRHVKLLVLAAFAVVNTHLPHWTRVVGYGPFSLCIIDKEGLCPSSGDINGLMMKSIAA